jgi:hypothetical protein
MFSSNVCFFFYSSNIPQSYVIILKFSLNQQGRV